MKVLAFAVGFAVCFSLGVIGVWKMIERDKVVGAQSMPAKPVIKNAEKSEEVTSPTSGVITFKNHFERTNTKSVQTNKDSWRGFVDEYKPERWIIVILHDGATVERELTYHINVTKEECDAAKVGDKWTAKK